MRPMPMKYLFFFILDMLDLPAQCDVFWERLSNLSFVTTLMATELPFSQYAYLAYLCPLTLSLLPLTSIHPATE